MTDLLTRVSRRALEDVAELPPGVDPASVEDALGFALHPLLARVYREVGDGGFGPDHQLMSLADAVAEYGQRRAAGAGTEWAWPEGVLPILTWGCAMYACVDCRSADGTVLLFEPNPGVPDQAWWVDSPTFEGWLAHYVEDTGWWAKLEAGEEVEEMPPWPQWRSRT